MNLKDIQKIVEMMQENELTDFEIEEEGFRISLKRNNGRPETAPTPHTVVMPAAPAATVAALPAAMPSSAETASEAPSGVVNPDSQITSPMVGTFYSSPSPEADPFLRIGDIVSEETVVCIIEAMKVMNEIKAEKSGVIKQILVNNGTAVQYGDPLFVIDPS